MRDLLRVALVHLAAVGLNEEFRHGSPTKNKGSGRGTPLGGGKGPAGKWVRFQTTAHFFVGPRVGAHFVEQGEPDDPDVASVVIFLGGVRFAHRAEAKGRHRFRALPKSFHYQLLMWI